MTDSWAKNFERARLLMTGPGFGHPGLSMRDTAVKLVREGVSRQDAYFIAQAARLDLGKKGIDVKKAVERLAQRWVFASPADGINRLLISVQGYRDDLILHEGTMTALVMAGEARRLDRSERVSVKKASFDGSAVAGDVQGVTGVYQARILLKPRRSFNCTCPDKAQRGRQVGPCKHVLALGKYWLNERITPALETLEDRLTGILERSDL